MSELAGLKTMMTLITIVQTLGIASWAAFIWFKYKAAKRETAKVREDWLEDQRTWKRVHDREKENVVEAKKQTEYDLAEAEDRHKKESEKLAKEFNDEVKRLNERQAVLEETWSTTVDENQQLQDMVVGLKREIDGLKKDLEQADHNYRDQSERMSTLIQANMELRNLLDQISQLSTLDKPEPAPESLSISPP